MDFLPNTIKETEFDIEKFLFDLKQFKQNLPIKISWHAISSFIGAGRDLRNNWMKRRTNPKTNVFLRACLMMQKDPMIYLKKREQQKNVHNQTASPTYEHEGSGVHKLKQS